MQPSSPMEAPGTTEADARRNFHDQAGYCRELGSPFTAELCDLLRSGLDHSSRFGRRALVHSIRWQHLPEAMKQRITVAMQKAGEAASLKHPSPGFAWRPMAGRRAPP